MADSRFPTLDGSTSTTVVNHYNEGITGTVCMDGADDGSKCLSSFVAIMASPSNKHFLSYPDTNGIRVDDGRYGIRIVRQLSKRYYTV